MPSCAALAVHLRRRAILCVLGASACYTVAAALVKAIGGGVPTWEVVFFRNAVAAACMVPLIRRAGGWSVLRTTRPLSHASPASSRPA